MLARNPEIEKILEAWWEFDHSPPSKRAETQKRLNELLEVIAAKSSYQFTREQIQDYLWPQYRDFRAERRKAENLRVAQRSLGGEAGRAE